MFQCAIISHSLKKNNREERRRCFMTERVLLTQKPPWIFNILLQFMGIILLEIGRFTGENEVGLPFAPINPILSIKMVSPHPCT